MASDATKAESSIANLTMRNLKDKEAADEALRVSAATVIQSRFRGYRQRKLYREYKASGMLSGTVLRCQPRHPRRPGAIA